MGLFQKFKDKFLNKKEIVEKVSEEKVKVEDLSEEEQDTIKYDKGLEKTRKEFVSELNLLGHRFTKVTDEYYDELESLLIKADIGVNTVFNFIDRLKDRVKHENIKPKSSSMNFL